MAQITRLSSLDDPSLDYYRNLKRTNLTRDRRHFIAEGEKLVLRLLDLNWPIESLVTSDRQLGRIEALLPDHFPTYVVSQEELEQLVGYNFHRGMLALAHRKPAKSLSELAVSARRLVVCGELRDPTNLGVVIRTAAAFGWDGIVLEPASPDPFSRRTLRTSMAAVLRIPTVVVPDQTDLPSVLEDFGFDTIATIARDATPIHEIVASEKIAVWLGNEDSGLSDEIASKCRKRVTIPTTQDVDSLNVAIAAGIVLQRFGIV